MEILLEGIRKEDIFASKEALFKSFMGDFYKFIKKQAKGRAKLAELNINSKEEFYAYADYYAGGKDNCYAFGFAFHYFWVKDRMDGSFETEKPDTFIGWCLKNHKYDVFLNFLLSFFAYWRNDEGCTRFDPYNYADNFFVSSWASLVDTCKLFYFSSETVYWWHSFRVKYCLDHIPGVVLEKKKDQPLKIAGFTCLGYFDKDGKQLEKPIDGCILKYKEHDVYNYWEKEEKTIKKVYPEVFVKVDPA